MPPPKVAITATTRIVGVIGDPIAHSRSPAMHNAAFQALGLPFAYCAFRVAPADVGAAVAAVRALGLAGLNVTIPHKQAVIPYLDRLSENARLAAAVNTIVNRDGTLAGDNTDITGLARALREAGLSRRVAHAVVLGAGGAARAAVVALGRRSGRVVVAARRPDRARELVESLAPALPATLEAVALADLAPGRAGVRAHLAPARVVVNATPVGMRGERFLPLDYAATPPRCLFYDLVYTQPRTPFLAGAARLGRPHANGLGMLLHQGAAAFEQWTGVAAPVEAMRRALRRRTV